jgi:hypothetical protein
MLLPGYLDGVECPMEVALLGRHRHHHRRRPHRHRLLP